MHGESEQFISAICGLRECIQDLGKVQIKPLLRKMMRLICYGRIYSLFKIQFAEFGTSEAIPTVGILWAWNIGPKEAVCLKIGLEEVNVFDETDVPH